MGKRSRIALLLLAALLILAGYTLYTPDLRHEDLLRKYGDGPSQFIRLADGTRVHYRAHGDRAAPVIVLLHGTSSNAFTWEGWARALSGRYRLISIDLPGHGLTGRIANEDYSDEAAVAFVKAVTEKLDLYRFALAGNSWGGELAGAFALANPRRVTQLILIDAGGIPLPEDGRKAPIAFQLMGKPVIGNMLAWITPRPIVAEAMHSIYGDPSKVSDGLIDLYHDMVRHEGNRQATRLRVRLGQTDLLGGRLKDIRQPTLILWGAKDGLIPLSIGRQFDEEIPNSTLQVFEDAGHVPMEEIPAETAAAAEAFLSSHSR
ncbi:MAG: alpha/beta fold hydrolase [Pseudomonadota bacterium]|jgi:pimeloyl-ACP methyl ester carboxylesterase